MTMPSSRIKTSDVIDRLGMIKQCPVTGGLPTTMTESGFAALCARKIENAGGWKYNYGKNKTRDEQTWCQVCQGKQRPKELQLVDVQTLAQLTKLQPSKGTEMATKKVRGVCEGGCGQTLQLSTDYGVKMCSTCGAAHSHVKNHAETVVAAIRRTDMLPWYLQQLAGETVTVKGESATLDSIAAVVGYDGESPDGLVGAVRACVEAATGKSEGWMACFPPDVVRALGMGAPWAVKDFELAVIQQAAQLEQLERLSSYLCMGLKEIAKTVGVDAQDFRRVSFAVAQSEAALEAIGAAVGTIDPMELVQAVSSLTLAYEERKKRVDALLAENTALANRTSELEWVGLVNEQIFTKLREMVPGDCLTNADLPSAIGSAINAGLSPFPAPCAPTEKPNIDTPLLDLALDAMRGDIKGLTPDRIAGLREAAQ